MAQRRMRCLVRSDSSVQRHEAVRRRLGTNADWPAGLPQPPRPVALFLGRRTLAHRLQLRMNVAIARSASEMVGRREFRSRDRERRSG